MPKEGRTWGFQANSYGTGITGDPREACSRHRSAHACFASGSNLLCLCASHLYVSGRLAKQSTLVDCEPFLIDGSISSLWCLHGKTWQSFYCWVSVRLNLVFSEQKPQASKLPATALPLPPSIPRPSHIAQQTLIIFPLIHESLPTPWSLWLGSKHLAEPCGLKCYRKNHKG